MTLYSDYRQTYYDDTDAGGVVYHANYLRYFDHARSRYLAQLTGSSLQQLQQVEQKLFAVVNINIDYKAPARLSDHLEVTVESVNQHVASCLFQQQVWLVDTARQRQKILCAAAITLVCLQAETFKPIRIPFSFNQSG